MECQPGDCIVARAPIYGTRDAGRRFWKKLKEVVTKTGLKQSSLCPALFTYSEDGDIKVMLGSHVDDLLFACKPGFEGYVSKIQKAFDVDDSKLTYKDFRFCGREISQDDEGNITVTCKATAEKIEPIQYRTGIKKTESCNDQEKAQLRSVVGSLAWVARQSRPDLSYRVSKLQSVTSKATIKDLVLANKTVEEAKEYSSHGLYFRAKAFDWNSAILVTVSDASWANEKEMVRGEMESFRSQRARMTLYLLTHNF